jgi:YgiT-type zinc finger domain-containing protein
METKLEKEPLQICSLCHIGRVVEKYLCYTEWYNEELIVIPGVPARVCDYCGEKEFDPFIVGTLQRLLWSDFNTVSEMTSPARIRSQHRDIQNLLSKGPFQSGE